MSGDSPDTRVPVTILTGFLGSGKTTLLNRILSEQHGQRIAVIENEFGEIGIDQDLVTGTQEDVVEMNNGCLCCTVRGDLIRVLGNLMLRREQFDAILIETSGLADPGPVAQAFFMDDEMKQHMRLDAIVTLVDARHIGLHLDDSEAAREQIAFADVVILNKVDLVEADELERIEARIRRMNQPARVLRAAQADIPIESILHIGGFSLDRALAVDPAFLAAQYAFEEAALYYLEAGRYQLVAHPGPTSQITFALLPPLDGDAGADLEVIDAVQGGAARIFATEPSNPGPREGLRPGMLYSVLVEHESTHAQILIAQAGRYVLFTEHRLEEFRAHLWQEGNRIEPSAVHEFEVDHEHDSSITSVGIRLAGGLAQDRLGVWLNELLMTRGDDIFRMKGIFSIEGSAERYVFQGVHKIFEGRPERAWGGEPRATTAVFIGRNLDREELLSGLRACLA